MHKALKTLVNEKEQQKIKYYKKSSGELIFSWMTKNLKMFYLTPLLGECSKSKVTLLNCVLASSTCSVALCSSQKLLRTIPSDNKSKICSLKQHKKLF